MEFYKIISQFLFSQVLLVSLYLKFNIFCNIVSIPAYVLSLLIHIKNDNKIFLLGTLTTIYNMYFSQNQKLLSLPDGLIK